MSGMTGFSVQDCQDACPVTDTFRGISYSPNLFCVCHYDGGTRPSVPDGFVTLADGNVGTGPVVPESASLPSNCYKYHPAQ